MQRLHLFVLATLVNIPLFAASWGGWLELKPSYVHSDGLFHSENEAALAFQATPEFALDYVQEFRSYNSQVKARDGYLKTEWIKPDPKSQTFYLEHEGACLCFCE